MHYNVYKIISFSWGGTAKWHKILDRKMPHHLAKVRFF